MRLFRKKTKVQLSGSKLPDVSAYRPGNARYNNMMPGIYDGEKTPYMMGRPETFDVDYYSMRAHAWEAFLKSDIVQNGIRKYCLWVVGAGLKLQSDIKSDLLVRVGEAITDEMAEDLQEQIESNFRLYSEMNESTFSENDNLHDQAAEALKNAIIAGDVLCISRYTAGRVSMEAIDGHFVQSPLGSTFYRDAEARGNTIIKGVEVDRRGRHVAFYVRQKDFTFRRVRAYGSRTGRRQAWLMYSGLKHKLTDTRGLSLFGAILETVGKLDRYKSAALSHAEENSKIPYTFEHDEHSDGSSPVKNMVAQSFMQGKGKAPETGSDSQYDSATNIAQTTEANVFNMPPGATLKRHDGKADYFLKEFLEPNIHIVYATLGIPPEIAMDLYTSNYSSSRAAIKSWEYKVSVDRITILKRKFYKPFYSFWLDFEVLDNTVSLPGYLAAMAEGDKKTLECYRNCRFIGAGVPHIDPEKEVRAERLKLGDTMKDVPLTTIDQVIENLNTGDFSQNVKKLKNERSKISDYINSADPGGQRSG